MRYNGTMNSKGKEEKILNDSQKEAINHKKGPVLVIAGAGTGKTTVVIERIKHVVSSGEAKTSEILALTFTEKAAKEMEERVDVALPYGYTDTWISTFHSFCDRVLRQDGIAIGIDPSYRLLTQVETIKLLKDNLFSLGLDYYRPLGNPTKFLYGLIAHYSRLKDEDVSPDEYEQWAKNQKDSEEAKRFLELAKAYKKYEKTKLANGLLDFGDLIFFTIKLFRLRKSVLEKYKKQFRHILVDEFQDTNYAQYSLIKLLAPPEENPNLMVVGDDSQSIYKFRGAAISNILQFMKEYKKANLVVLDKNYRSTQTILDHAYKLIKNNDPDTLEAKLGVSKDLKAVRKVKEEPVRLIHTGRVEDEAEIVTKEIQSLLRSGYKNKDIAILVRANNHATPFSQAMAKAGIAYQFLGPSQLFRQPEVKDLIAYLKVIYDFTDNVAFYRVLSNRVFDLSGRDLASIVNYSRRKNVSLFEAAEKAEEVFLSQESRKSLKKLVEMIHHHLNLVPKETGGQILYYFIRDSGILRELASAKSHQEERRAKNIAIFFDRLKSYELNNEDASIFPIVDWINLSMEIGESPLASDMDWFEEDKVNILTVHSAKGLEFPVVFLVNLVNGRFPSRERREQIPMPESLIKEILPSGDYHQEEERRLFYVGLTRAKDRIFLTYADYYGEGKRGARVSPFVLETLGKEYFEKLDVIPKIANSNQLSFFEWEKVEQPDIQAFSARTVGYLSYSQIECFEHCPLQYRYRYVQRIPVLPSSAASFGSTVHKTLNDFYQLVKNGNKPTEEKLIELFDRNWSDEGYSSKQHEQKRRKEGRKMLSNYFKNVYLKENLQVVGLEQNFILKITPALKIGGKIDRINNIGGRIEIIDYKTGKSWDQKEVDKSLQMTVYALAAEDPFVGFGSEDIDLSLYFLETGEKKSTRRTKKQLVAARKDLINKAAEIGCSDFPSKPSPLCDFCDFRLICEAWSK